MNTLGQQVEALLFTAGEAVSITDLSELTHESAENIGNTLEEISTSISDSGITLLITNTHAQLVTSPSVAEFLVQFTSPEDTALSKAALETLSLIAYRGPISRLDIDVIRGVDSRRMVRHLLYRGLIRQIRTAGQAIQYETTEEFLLHIGITSKEELPNYEALATNENITRIITEPS